jgi:membrane fusion protein, multidrug efflux system
MHKLAYVFMAAGLLYLPTLSAGGPPAMPPAPVEVAKPQQRSVAHGTVATGELKAIRSVTIKSEIPGKVTKLNLPEGQFVPQGKLLIELDEGVAKSTLNQMMAKFENSQRRYERLQVLKDKGVLSDSERDEAFSNYRFDKASVDLAKAHYEKTQIKAPFSGILGLKHIHVGENVDPGQTLITLTDTSTLYVDFNLPEHHFTQIKENQAVELQLDAIPQKTFAGKIYAISPQIDQRTHTIAARAAVANPENILRPGLFAKIKVVFSKNDAALTVPEQAVFNVQNKSFLYKIVDGKAALTEVNIGVRENGHVEVLKGITAKDSIAKSGHMKLYDGAQILDIEQMKQQKPA